jgi:hypothetical protein
VSVAQLVEHRSVAPRVAGSIPVAHPNPSRLNPDYVAVSIAMTLPITRQLFRVERDVVLVKITHVYAFGMGTPALSGR